MSETVEQLALRVSASMPDGFIWYEGCGWENGVLNDEIVAYTKAFLSELAKQQKPVAWAHFAENGNIRIWTSAPKDVRRLGNSVGFELVPLYNNPAIPQPAEGGNIKGDE